MARTAQAKVSDKKDAMSLLMKNKSVVERAESYYTSIKRNIEKEVIDPLIVRRDALTDKIFDLQDFNLDTDRNKGMERMSKEDCDKRFKDLIQAEYDLELVNRELAIKRASFEKYFSNENA